MSAPMPTPSSGAHMEAAALLMGLPGLVQLHLLRLLDALNGLSEDDLARIDVLLTTLLDPGMGERVPSTVRPYLSSARNLASRFGAVRQAQGEFLNVD